MRSDSIKDIEKTAIFVDASGSNGGHLCTCTKMDDWRSSNCQVVQTSNLLKGTICFFFKVLIHVYIMELPVITHI